MGLRKLGSWLAILAIALQAAWPLLAAAKSRAVTLVPLCTVDGVTHYLEVPTGKAPPDDSTGHQDHCSFCFLSTGGLLSLHTELALPPGVRAEPVAPHFDAWAPSFQANLHGARAPPFPLSVMLDQPNRGNHEIASAFERRCTGAVAADPGARVLRLGVLHR